jgi:hypothetical protein
VTEEKAMPVPVPLKVDCRYVGALNLRNVPNAESYMRLNHPSFQVALDALADYNRWVCQVVLPIAFEWIEEHHDAVYEKVAAGREDEVGAVIAAAFDLLKQIGAAYQDSLVKRAQVEADLRNGTRQIEQFNPIWNHVSHQLSEQIQAILNQYNHVLPDTESVSAPEEPAALIAM